MSHISVRPLNDDEWDLIESLLGLSISGTNQGIAKTSATSFANVTFSGGGTAAIWGNITGTLSNQTDLYSVLNLAGTASLSTTTAKSLYTMTSTIPVEFRSSDGNPILYIDETNERIGIGTASPAAGIESTRYAGTTDLIGLRLSGTWGTATAHPFQSTINHPLAAGEAYATYDDLSTTSGTANQNHVVSYQARATHASSGTLDNLYGAYMFPTNNGGAITNRYGMVVADIGGVGTVTNNYGLYVSSLTRGATLNYAVYTDGTTKSYFGGNVGIGKTGAVAKLDVSATAGSLVNIANFVTPSMTANQQNYIVFGSATSANNGFSMVYNHNATATSRYLAIQGNESAFGSQLVLLAGGNVGIGTTTPSTLLQLGLAGTTLGTFSLAGNTSGLVTIQPAAAAGTWTLTLPTDDGTVGQFLQTDGAGISSWQTVATGITVGTTTITSGTDTRVLFQDGTTVGQSANFTWDKTYLGNLGNLKAGVAISMVNLANTAVMFRRAASGNGFYLGYSAAGNSGEFSSYSEFSIGASANASGSGSISIGSNSTSASASSFALGHYAATTDVNQMVIGSPTIYYSNVYFNGVTHTAPFAAVLNASGGSGTNIAGAAMTIAGGKATGNAAGGSILFQTSVAGGTGTTLQSLATIASITSAGYFNLNYATATRVPYIDASKNLVDSADMTWDNTNKILNISTTQNNTSGINFNGLNAIRVNRTYAFVSLGYGTTPQQTAGVTLIGGETGGIAAATGAYSTYLGSYSAYNGGSGAYNTGLGSYTFSTSTTGITSSIAIGYLAIPTASNQLVIGSSDANGSVTAAYLGQGVTKASPAGIIINATGGSGTDNTGASLTLAGGKGTGAGAPGSYIVQTSTTLGTGTTLQTLVTRLTISGGAVTTDASTATWADKLDMAFNTGTGTKLGTATTQKIGFWNATPIVQPANTVAIDDVLVNTGLRASGGAANFTLKITNNLPQNLKGYAVGSLPAGVVGDIAYVNDATVVPAKGVAPVAGGTAVGAVFFDGTIWVGI